MMWQIKLKKFIKGEIMFRVLHSVSNMDRAGIETMLMNYYRHINKDIIQFDFLCNKKKLGDYDKEIVKMGGHIFRTPGLNPMNFLKYEKYMKELFLNNSDIKIMHSHNGEFAYQSLRAAKKFGIKTRICHAHNTRIEPNLKKPLKLMYKTQLKNVANNYWGCGKDAISFYFGKKVLDDNNFMVLNNAIEVKRFSYNEAKRGELRKKLGIENKFVIGNVGRFSEQKNHRFILKIFEGVLKKEPDAILLLIGTGELLEKMKKLAMKLKIFDSVMFMGSRSDVNELYQAMDVFLLPSLFEGLPVVGIEAQASGLKCIFSDRITNEVRITDDVIYLNLKNDSIDKWTEALLECRSYERKDTSELIRKSGYSIEEEAKKLEKKYLELIGEKRESQCNY